MTAPPVACIAVTAAALLAACANLPTAEAMRMRTDDVFNRIPPGITQDEVRRLLGRPDETMPFPLSRTIAWDYQYQDTWGYLAVFSVTFGADGRAVSKFSRRINDGADHSNR